MDNTLSFKKKALFFLFLAIFIYFLSFFLYSFNDLFSSHEKTIRIFQEKIIDKENELDIYLNETIKTIHETDSNLTFEYFYDKINPADNKNISLFIFIDERLTYWSGTNIQVFPDLWKNNFENASLKISNGIYDIRSVQSEEIIIYGMLMVKKAYPYENDHLTNKFASFLDVSSEINLSLNDSENKIYNKDGAYLFSLDFSNFSGKDESLEAIFAIIYILSYLLLISSIYYGYKALGKYFNNKYLLFAGFVIDLALIRYVIHYFSFPNFVHQTRLFLPELYASSTFSPSLGDLFLNLITLFAIGYAFFHLLNLKYIQSIPNSPAKSTLAISGLTFVFISYFLLTIGLCNIVMHSSISFNLADITSISLYSVLGFICFGLFLFTFYLFTFKLVLFFFSTISSNILRIAIPVIHFIPFIFLSRYYIDFDPQHVLFLFFYILLIFYINTKGIKNVRFSSTVILILLFSWLSTFILNNSVTKKEKADRTLLAQALINQRDPIIEYAFSQAEGLIISDKELQDRLNGFPFEDNSKYNRIIDSIYNVYFASFKANSEIWLTLCDSAAEIDISSNGISENCHNYFTFAVEEFGQTTDYDNLYYIDNVRNEDNYLGVIELPGVNNSLKLYVEIFNIYATSKIGYPELLVDKREGSGLKLADYSYCMYEEGVQINQYGNFFYALNLSRYSLNADKPIQFFDRNGYEHVLYAPDRQNAIIVSTKKQGLIDIIAPFSYISIFLGIMTFLFFLLFRGPGKFSFNLLGFKKRLQLSVMAIIIISFLFVGIGSLIYLVGINQNKNISVLQEKSRSVLIELKHKLEAEESLTWEMESYLETLLVKFSQVFFSDINLYDLEGQLLATSRKAVFRKALVSEMMNSTAFLNMHSLDKSLYIHEEKIGEYSYLSAYMPLRNNDSKLIAYLNLPYFAKQDELTNEISTFLVAFINVYVILIAFSIYLALVISNYITKPIELIRERIGKLKLGKSEEKIEWHRQDEIGSLITEYNRMVDELALSAERLAKSERESAWREMAKQIAHEIKNPLTPMKLSVQYLQKAWDEKAPDWDDRLHKFSNTIIEQINSLSIIATEFSDFAKMPRSKFENINLSGIIQNSIGIFKQSSDIRFEFQPPSPCFVFADKEQLLRVFNNLIKNSIQAIPDPKDGLIKILLTSDEGYHTIQIIDNGKGIPMDMQEKVFYPNFTTKSGGMGLGLAMVKNIVENAKGEISFDSEETVGTTFTIIFPRSTGEVESES